MQPGPISQTVEDSSCGSGNENHTRFFRVTAHRTLAYR